MRWPALNEWVTEDRRSSEVAICSGWAVPISNVPP